MWKEAAPALNAKVPKGCALFSELPLLCKSLHTQEYKANSQTLHVHCVVIEESKPLLAEE